jgi:hypothetical protein
MGVPGKETNGNQVPFRGRHNQLAGSPQFRQPRDDNHVADDYPGTGRCEKIDFADFIEV